MEFGRYFMEVAVVFWCLIVLAKMGIIGEREREREREHWWVFEERDIKNLTKVFFKLVMDRCPSNILTHIPICRK